MASLTRIRAVVDHTMLTALQRSTKLKISHWYFDQWLYTINIIFCQNILSKRFSIRIFLTRIHLMRCLSSTVNLIAVTTVVVFFWTQCILLLTKTARRILGCPRLTQPPTLRGKVNEFQLMVEPLIRLRHNGAIEICFDWLTDWKLNGDGGRRR